MDESQALELAVGVVGKLDSIDAGVTQLRELLQAHIEHLPELVQPSQPEAQPLALDDSDSDGWTTVVTATEPLPDDWASDLLHFQYMQLCVSVALLVALCLNVGATLWLAFSRNWRS